MGSSPERSMSWPDRRRQEWRSPHDEPYPPGPNVWLAEPPVPNVRIEAHTHIPDEHPHPRRWQARTHLLTLHSDEAPVSAEIRTAPGNGLTLPFLVTFKYVPEGGPELVLPAAPHPFLRGQAYAESSSLWWAAVEAGVILTGWASLVPLLGPECSEDALLAAVTGLGPAECWTALHSPACTEGVQAAAALLKDEYLKVRPEKAFRRP